MPFKNGSCSAIGGVVDSGWGGNVIWRSLFENLRFDSFVENVGGVEFSRGFHVGGVSSLDASFVLYSL